MVIKCRFIITLIFRVSCVLANTVLRVHVYNVPVAQCISVLEVIIFFSLSERCILFLVHGFACMCLIQPNGLPSFNMCCKCLVQCFRCFFCRATQKRSICSDGPSCLFALSVGHISGLCQKFLLCLFFFHFAGAFIHSFIH